MIVRRQNDVFSDFLGFILGFFGGCCGLGLAALVFRRTLRGAIAGITANIGLGVLFALMAGPSPSGAIPVIHPDGSPVLPEIPWDLVVAFGLGTVLVVGMSAAAVHILFGGGGDDDDDDSGLPPDHRYVTFRQR